MYQLPPVHPLSTPVIYIVQKHKRNTATGKTFKGRVFRACFVRTILNMRLFAGITSFLEKLPRRHLCGRSYPKYLAPIYYILSRRLLQMNLPDGKKGIPQIVNKKNKLEISGLIFMPSILLFLYFCFNVNSVDIQPLSMYND